MLLTAIYYLPQSSQSVDVQLSLNGDCLSFSYQAQQKSFSLDSLKISDALGNTPRQVICPDGSVLHVTANNEFNQWLGKYQKHSKSSVLEQHKLAIVTALILVPVFMFALYRYLIPAFAVQFAELIPDKVKHIASQQTLYSLDKTLLSASELTKQQQQEYQLQWQTSFAQLLGTKETKYRVNFRHSKVMGANAFALPDGTIVVTDELIELMKDSPNAIKAVLLHEIGHVEQQHSMRLVAESVANALVVNYLFGDFSGMIDMFVGSSSAVVNNQFSQKLELEADNFAIKRLIAQQGNAQDFVDALQALGKLYQDHPSDALFSSHPLLADRIANAKAAH